MPLSSLTAYTNNTNAEAFPLVSTSDLVTRWQYTNRPLSAPWEIAFSKKIAPPGAKSNDHVVLKVTRVENNAITGIPATCVVSLDISIPRDSTILTPTVVGDQVSVIASLLNDSTAMETTRNAINALVNGRAL